MFWKSIKLNLRVVNKKKKDGNKAGKCKTSVRKKCHVDTFLQTHVKAHCAVVVVVVVVVVCFIQRPSKYIETTHITTFGRKKGNSDKTRTVKACNIQPYNEFKN